MKGIWDCFLSSFELGLVTSKQKYSLKFLVWSDFFFPHHQIKQEDEPQTGTVHVSPRAGKFGFTFSPNSN